MVLGVGAFGMMKPKPVRLNHHQWQVLDQVAYDVQSCASPDDLIQIATQEVPKILSADWACWNEHDPQIKVMNVHITPGFDDVTQSYLPEINEHMSTHPVIRGLDLFDNPKAMEGVWSLTDFEPESKLDSVAIWSEAYRHMSAKHQMLSEFCSDGENRILLTLNADQAFSEEQRTMLGVMTRHFQAACRRLALHVPLKASDGSRPTLTRREQEILVYLLEGKSNPEIAIITGTSPRTVEKHVARVLLEFHVDTRLQLLSLILRQRQG